jgi:hypothetical protein
MIFLTGNGLRNKIFKYGQTHWTFCMSKNQSQNFIYKNPSEAQKLNPECCQGLANISILTIPQILTII